MNRRTIGSQSGQAFVEVMVWSMMIALTFLVGAKVFSRQYEAYRGLFSKAQSPSVVLP